MRKILVMLAVSILLAGCGADSSAEVEALQERIDQLEAEATTTAPTTTTAAAPTTTTVPADPYEEAGEYYLEIIAIHNCSLQLGQLGAATAPGNEDKSISEWEWPAYRDHMRPFWIDSRETKISTVEALAAYEWPADVQSFIDELASDYSRDGINYDLMAKAVSFDDFRRLDLKWDTTAASVIRSKLGLPSNINSDVDWCAEAGL